MFRIGATVYGKKDRVALRMELRLLFVILLLLPEELMSNTIKTIKGKRTSKKSINFFLKFEKNNLKLAI